MLLLSKIEITPVFWEGSSLLVKLDSVLSNNIWGAVCGWSILFIIILISMLLVRVTSMCVSIDSTLIWLVDSK